MNPQQWLPGSSSHRSSSSGSETMRQSATYPQAQAPSLRHDQTPTIASTDMVGKGCRVGLFVLPCSGYGKRVRYCPRDARQNRSTPDLGRPCESDAGFRVCRPRPCLLSARRLSTDSARFDTPSLSSPKQDACALCPEKDVYVKNININRNRDRSERPYNYKYVKSEKVKTRDLRKRMFSVAAHGS